VAVESGNPAVWAGFPSEVRKSEGFFHGTSFPQSSPARFASSLAGRAIPARCSDPQREAHSECSSSDRDVRKRPNAELTLKRSSVRYYGFQFDRHIVPSLGSSSLCDLSRGQIEAFLSNLRQKGHAGATLRGVRATLSTVLQAAVERGYLEKNPAHGIRIRGADAKNRAQVLFTCSGAPASCKTHGTLPYRRTARRTHGNANR
jgi:hypothetical protein